MFIIHWYNKNQWFHTSDVYTAYRTDEFAIQKLKTEIEKNLNYWQSLVTYEIFLDDQNVTEWYKDQSRV